MKVQRRPHKQARLHDVTVHPGDSLPIDLPHPLEVARLALLCPARWTEEHAVDHVLSMIGTACSCLQRTLERRKVLDKLPRRTSYVEACKQWFPGSRSMRENDSRVRQILASLGKNAFCDLGPDEEIARMKSDGVEPMRMYHISRLAELMQKQKQSQAGKTAANQRWKKKTLGEKILLTALLGARSQVASQTCCPASTT